jgi:hypothetical protein
MNYFENYKMAKLRFNPYRIFNIDDRIYLYVINTSGLFEIDSGFLKLLSEEGNTIESVYLSIQDIFSYDEFESIDMSTLFWTYFYRTIYINFHEFVCYFKIIYLFQSRVNKLAITRP